MEGLERLEDNQFYGTVQTGFQPFRSLKTLKFTELPRWRHWIHSAHGDEDFPSLQELQIQQCPQFIGSLPRYPSSTNREISGCPRFEEEEDELTRRVQPQASTDQEEESARRVRPRRCWRRWKGGRQCTQFCIHFTFRVFFLFFSFSFLRFGSFEYFQTLTLEPWLLHFVKLVVQ